MSSQPTKPGHMKYDEWIKHWSNDDAPFHVEEPDEILIKYETEIVGGGPKKVFVPLCGKVVDMKWLYDKGHTVVGVEISEKAVADFFKEQKLECEVEQVVDVGNCYKTKDGRVKLYAADIFKVTTNVVGVFDVIWDSGGLSVINKDDRPRYFQLMKSLMKPETKYFANGADYDSTVWPGPPHPLNVPELTKMCGDLFNVTELHVSDMSTHVTDGEGGPAKQPESDAQKPADQGNKDKEQSIDCFSQIEKAILKSKFMYFSYHKLTLK